MKYCPAPALAAALTIALIGCEPAPASSPSAPASPSARASAQTEPDEQAPQPAPFDLSRVDRGVGLYHGGPLGAAEGGAPALKGVLDGAPHAMLHVPAYDTLALSFGAYTYFVVGNVGSSVGTFIADPRLGRAAARAQDLQDELGEAIALAGAIAPASVSVTLDLWRPDGSWFVRWDGNLESAENRSGTDYGFGDKTLVDDLLGEVEAIAAAQKPRYFILGREMERLWTFSQGPDTAKAEWLGFTAFVREASARIKAASPQTKVGVGVEWDRFVDEVAPAYVELAGVTELPEGESMATYGTFYAMRGLLAPLWEATDVIAISSYATPNKDQDAAYSVLASAPERLGFERPVVVYSAGSPVESVGATSAQGLYADSLGDRFDGVAIEAIYWRRLIDIDGAQGGNQQIGGRCAELVENQERGFLIPRPSCFDGLLSTLFRAKGAAQTWATGL